MKFLRLKILSKYQSTKSGFKMPKIFSFVTLDINEGIR